MAALAKQSKDPNFCIHITYWLLPICYTEIVKLHCFIYNFTCMNLLFLFFFFSSFLEVKCLNRKRKDEAKEHRNPNKHNSHDTNKFTFETKITPHIIFHSLAWLKCFLYVSKLWSYQSVQGPRHWTGPKVPSPPDWHSL